MKIMMKVVATATPLDLYTWGDGGREGGTKVGSGITLSVYGNKTLTVRFVL